MANAPQTAGLGYEVAIAPAFAKGLSTGRTQNQRARPPGEIAAQFGGEPGLCRDRGNHGRLGVADLEHHRPAGLEQGGELGDERAVIPLTGALDHADEGVREAARDALRRLQST